MSWLWCFLDVVMIVLLYDLNVVNWNIFRLRMKFVTGMGYMVEMGKGEFVVVFFGCCYDCFVI